MPKQRTPRRYIKEKVDKSLKLGPDFKVRNSSLTNSAIREGIYKNKRRIIKVIDLDKPSKTIKTILQFLSNEPNPKRSFVEYYNKMINELNKLGLESPVKKAILKENKLYIISKNITPRDNLLRKDFRLLDLPENYHNQFIEIYTKLLDKGYTIPPDLLEVSNSKLNIIDIDFLVVQKILRKTNLNLNDYFKDSNIRFYLEQAKNKNELDKTINIFHKIFSKLSNPVLKIIYIRKLERILEDFKHLK